VIPASDPLAQLAAPPIFVVGAHRSGTTWVFDLLTALPGVAGVFESGLFSTDLGIAPLFHPVHWYEDQAELAEDQTFFGRAFRLSQLLSREQALADVRDLSARWLAHALGPNDRYLVEKTPQHGQVIRLISELFPGAIFIHVLRDGRDVVVSMRAAARSWKRGKVRETTVAQAAGGWADAVQRARAAGAESHLNFVEVRYEELRAEPVPILRRLVDAVGIRVDDAAIAAAVSERALSSHPGRSPDAFRRTGRVGDWRDELSIRERRTFEQVAGATLRETGYESTPGWWRPGPRNLARRGAS
jgi:LPS sulfotransferase NodH